MSDKKEISVETTDWKLGCFLDWRAKSHSETCPTCKGNRTVGGGFKDLDGPQECPTCFGIGSVTKGPTTLKPELPKALVEHMRRAWWDFFNSEQPALAALTSAPAVPEAMDKQALIDWVVGCWHAEVAKRPLVNVHRRSLDDTWRQMLRHLGVDDRARIGPTHDELLDAAKGVQPGERGE